jgi:hypothetical protein
MRFTTILATGATVAAALLTFSASAGASTAPQWVGNPPTHLCKAGANTGYCGTLKSEGSSTGAHQSLRIAVKGSSGSDTTVRGSVNPGHGAVSGGRTSDAFLWLSRGGHKVAEFTPNGFKTGYFLADVGGTVELQAEVRSNSEWDFTCTTGCGGTTPTGSVTNVATGRDLEVTTARGKVITVPAPRTLPAAAQFKFVTP